MLQAPRTKSDECPKCGEKIMDCICSTTSSENIEVATPKMVPAAAAPYISTENKPEDTLPRKALKSASESNITIIEPRVGNVKRPRHPTRDRIDWEEIEDPERYTLPPVDRNLYDLQNSQSSKDRLIEPKPIGSKSPASRRRSHKLKEVIVPEEPPTKTVVLRETPDEDYYRRKGCWCSDCPWLFAYVIYAVIWLIFMGILWKKKSFVDSHISIEDSKCILLCSELVAPSRRLDEERTTSTTFHCRRDVEKWEKDVFRPWRGIIDPNGNPNCVHDCNSFPSKDSFIASCVKDEARMVGTNGRRGIFHPGSALVYVDSIKGHWYWIVHVILITNAVSLFILLVPLFFCCPMVAFFVAASVLSSLILTILLWLELVQMIIWEDNERLPSSVIGTSWIFTIASTLFSGYVIYKAIVIFKRFRITCAIAGLASRVVNSIPMVLLEAILTMILLFILVALIIFVTLGIESSAVLAVVGSEYSYEISPFLWFARIYTMIFGYWTAQLLINCQTIILHGVMARYYFEKNLKNKVLKSHCRLLKYHMCTACFSALLFNWLYWIRRCRAKSKIRSRSLFGTGAFGRPFCSASKTVKKLVYADPLVTKRIDKANPYFFLVHVLIVTIIAIVCHLVFSGPYSRAFWPDFLMITYSYFVSLSAVNIYRVTKDAMFLGYVEDKTLTKQNPTRTMKMPQPVSVFFGYETRVVPR